MFLLRSAFWLTVMFIVIAPKGVDLGKTAADASRQALDIGQKAVISQVLAKDCGSLQCMGGKAALAVLSNDSAHLLGGASGEAPVPLPRPRPDRIS